MPGIAFAAFLDPSINVAVSQREFGKVLAGVRCWAAAPVLGGRIGAEIAATPGEDLKAQGHSTSNDTHGFDSFKLLTCLDGSSSSEYVIQM